MMWLFFFGGYFNLYFDKGFRSVWKCSFDGFVLIGVIFVNDM